MKLPTCCRVESRAELVYHVIDLLWIFEEKKNLKSL
jgi:hypothetical protein